MKNQKGFEEFKNADSISAPLGLSDQILAQVRSDLNPSAWLVLSKLSVIHFFTALVTLSICPQFGFRVFGEGMGLMHYFMSLGNYGCMAACGSFFLGSSILVAMVVLRPEEIRVIRRHWALELSALTLASAGFFLMLNTQLVVGFILAWMVGSLLGGLLTLEAGWNIRLRLIGRT